MYVFRNFCQTLNPQFQNLGKMEVEGGGEEKLLHNRKIPEPGERGGEGKVYKKQTFTSAWGTENIKITVKA